MKRRAFLAATALSPLLFTARNGFADSWQQGFKAGLAQHPWLLGYQTATAQQYQSNLLTLEGQIPQALRGTLFRNGPARHEIGDFRYQHWFDGDGMIQAWCFDDAGARHQGKMIQTRKYLAERAAGRALYPGFATVPPDPRPVTSPDSVNAGNISVLHHHGKLLALWEAGSAWEIDPQTLETNGICQFSDETSGLPFSAHPRVEPDGTLWNFGYVSNAHLLVLWHIDKDGTLQNVGTIPCDPISMPHDFLVTDKHIVILIPPLHFQPDEAGGGGFLDAHKWNADLPTRVLVVDKNDFSTYQWAELPAQWVFHFGNAWEDNSGVIHFDGARAPDPIMVLNQFREIMRGVITSEATPSVHTRYRLDTVKNTVSEAPMLAFNIDSEFPVIDPRVSCRRNNRLVMLTREHGSSAEHPNLNAVSVFDDTTQRLTSYTYPDHIIPEEHLFVAKPGSAPESDGWIIGSSLNFADARTEISVFDVRAVDAGPVYRAAAPYALPLGLHGRFVQA